MTRKATGEPGVENWYPGHMAKAMRRIGEYLSLIDIVVEVVDARIPRIGRNPLLDRLAARRARVLVLDREDLADPATTRAWLERFRSEQLAAVAVDGRARGSVAKAATAMVREAKRREGPSRAIVVGLPNAGKSTIINALLGRAVAQTQDRPGITRQLQWFRLSANVELMDTPGILVPKIDSTATQWKLAACGALPNERYDPERVAAAFHLWLLERQPRTRVASPEAFARSRGFRTHGGEIDFHTAARSYVRELQRGTFGRFSYESPDDDTAAA